MENKDSDPNQTKKDLMRLHFKCEEYRGQLLHPCIMLEQLMEDIVAMYFVDDRQRLLEFREIFLSTDKINVNHKRELLGFILKKRYKHIIEHNENLLKIIEGIFSERNVVAHARINETYNLVKNFDGDTVTFYTYKTKDGALKEKSLILNRSEVDKRVKEIIDVCRILFPIAETLRSGIAQPKVDPPTEM